MCVKLVFVKRVFAGFLWRYGQSNVWFARDISSVIHLNDQKSGIKTNETFPMMIGRRMTKVFADPTQTRVRYNMLFTFVYRKSVLSPAQPNFFTGRIMSVNLVPGLEVNKVMPY